MSHPYAIRKVEAMMILDSRGNPTIECRVELEGGGSGTAAVPAGASKGRYEAVELRDGGSEYSGKGVSKAVNNVNSIIAREIVGMDARRLRAVDHKLIELDGTPNKARLGANALLSVSVAVAKAAANQLGIPLYQFVGGVNAHLLPAPMMNVINGGVHAGNELSLQEFMIVPVGADSFAESLRIGVEVYHSLKKVLRSSYGASAVNVGDEGGFAPPMRRADEALSAIVKAIKAAGYVPGDDVFLAIDAAATQLFDPKKGVYVMDGRELPPDRLLSFYEDLVDSYPIASIEDPFHEEDFTSFMELTKKLGGRVLIVGDDLYVTNAERIKRGLALRSSNAVLVKPNQVGTLTETLDAVNLAASGGMKVIISHRSGETEDTFIADLAVAVNSGLIKAGAPARSERTSKYNRLLKIERGLQSSARFAGRAPFPRQRYL